jgi:hypothetical protein|tara:strand:- start:4486 stop:5871 length:1386 start_codon:yes stop_codon:yes gene_type:complete
MTAQTNQTSTQLTADYLVVGAGAMGMAFVDELLSGNATATVVLVDRYAGPGGHWRRSYPFVSLHQPAAFYGVNSETLGRGGKSLASGVEVVGYFQRVLEKHLAAGRLSFYPHCEYTDAHEFSSTVTGENYSVEVKHKVVDATYMKVEVPSMRSPPYRVVHGVEVVPPNALADISKPYTGYVIVGAGKTGMDAVLYLLGLGLNADLITWIMPNDAWLLDRGNIHPDGLLQSLSKQQEVIAKSETLEALLLNLEADGVLMRIDKSVWAEKYRCATVNREELGQLRKVKNIVRSGRVVSIEDSQVVLENGSFNVPRQTLFVDCSANGLSNRPIVPVFAAKKITLQSVSMCQQVYSASLIAHVETAFNDLEMQNNLCRVVPHPETIDDYLYAVRIGAMNNATWGKHLSKWVRNARLSFRSHIPTWRLFLKMPHMIKLAPLVSKNLKTIAQQRETKKESAKSAKAT